jgi:hypothetical protein
MPSLIGSKPNQVSTNADLGSLAFRDFVGLNVTGTPAPTVASAATIIVSAPVTFVSGTTGIDNIQVPLNMVGGGQIVLIPTGLWSTTTSGNIALATTAVVSRVVIMVYDSVTNKWYPSY